MGSGRQLLPQDQGCQAQVLGPRGYRSHTVTGATRDKDAAADADADAATPTTQPHGGAAAAAGSVEPQQALPPALGARASGRQGVTVVGRMLGPKADAN